MRRSAGWIETNRPGAGNILIFNNGIGRNYSTINEIAPPVDVTGAYARATAAAFGPPTNVWLYTASPPTNFYSAEISGCQRQPNGNTLICEGIKGNLFEVNAAGQTVWRYLCPVTTELLHQGDAIPVDPARTDQFMNAVFRVYRYAPDFPGLAGKDLTPYGVIEIYQDAPAVDLTNAATTVDYGVTTIAIGGLNNAYVVGMMTWTNRLTGACAAFSATTAWRADDIGLAIGDNIIVVAGTNAAGIPACDKVTITRLLPEPALMLGLVCALWALRRAA